MLKELQKGGSAIYRDELAIKKHRGEATPMMMEGFIQSGSDGREGWYRKNGSGEKGVQVRVKLKLTKKEAQLLLQKCKGTGVLKLGDVPHELGRIPENRIVSMDVISRRIADLECIPEEKHGLCDDS